MSKSVAILIGVGSFDDPTFKSLRFCDNDVNELGRVLSDRDVAAFDITKLIAPTRNDILTTLERSSALVRPEDKLLFYFAGHGKRSSAGRLYLVAKDTRADTLRSTGVPIDQVLELMQESHSSQRVMILDCCHSGAIGDEFRGEINDSMQELARARGTCILAASTGIQLAEEREAVSAEGKGNGIFTRHLVEGLESGAAAVNDADYVTVDSLYDFAFQRVVASSKQTPMKWVIGSVGNIVLAKSSSGGWQSQKALVLKEFVNLHDSRLITGKLLDEIRRITDKSWNQLSTEDRAFGEKLTAFVRKSMTLEELLANANAKRSREQDPPIQDVVTVRHPPVEPPPPEPPSPEPEGPPAPVPPTSAEALGKMARFMFLTGLGPIISFFLMLWLAILFNWSAATSRVFASFIAVYSLALFVRVMRQWHAGQKISKLNLSVILVSLGISVILLAVLS